MRLRHSSSEFAANNTYSNSKCLSNHRQALIFYLRGFGRDDPPRCESLRCGRDVLRRD